MSRERVTEIALRAYPPPVRAAEQVALQRRLLLPVRPGHDHRPVEVVVGGPPLELRAELLGRLAEGVGVVADPVVAVPAFREPSGPVAGKAVVVDVSDPFESLDRVRLLCRRAL